MKFETLVVVLLVCAGAVIFSCGRQAAPPFDVKTMDLSVEPGDNFYRFVNGTWLDNNPIPDEYSRYGVFEYLFEKNSKDLRVLLKDVSKSNAEAGSVADKIGKFYQSGMDVDKIEADGIEPLQQELDAIDQIATMSGVQAAVARYQTCGINPLFTVFAHTDAKNSNLVIAHIGQGGLGLPDRDYYLKEDARSSEIREAYVKHVAAMMGLAGLAEDQVQEAAKRVMAFETRLAKASMSLLDRRDPFKTYNKMSTQKLSKTVPRIDWASYFDAIGLEDPGEVNVRQPDFFKEIGAMMADTDIADWKLYLKWNLVNRNAEFLSEDFVNQDFDFYGKTLSGTQALQERWKRVLGTTNGALGEAVGQLYVEKHFPPEAKERMLDLVMNLKASLKERINALDWMSEQTKARALEKLAVMNFKIGYPDQWRDYSTLEVKDDSYVWNVIRGHQFEFKRDMAKVNKPVDKKEWFMYPQTVNAYYSPSMNEIVFPAAILQPPFFNLAADDAMNYGGIGFVIGHEMTHGFDDKGRYYDKDGNLNDWWTEQDADAFKARAQVLVDQFNGMTLLDSLHVDGALTLGENIADLGGLNISLSALEKTLKDQPEVLIDGYTPTQRFFLSMAQVWRNNIRDEELMRRLREDVHSPGQCRVNGPVANMPAFYTAFNIKPENRLYVPEDEQARIW